MSLNSQSLKSQFILMKRKTVNGFNPGVTWNKGNRRRLQAGYKMTEKPNQGANSQSSQLDEEDLHKLVGDGGNNVCSSSMAGGEVNVNLSRRAKPAQLRNCTALILTIPNSVAALRASLAIYTYILYYHFPKVPQFDQRCWKTSRDNRLIY